MQLLLTLSAFFLLGVITRVKSRNDEQGDNRAISDRRCEQDRGGPVDNGERINDPIIHQNEPNVAGNGAGDDLPSEHSGS